MLHLTLDTVRQQSSSCSAAAGRSCQGGPRRPNFWNNHEMKCVFVFRQKDRLAAHQTCFSVSNILGECQQIKPFGVAGRNGKEKGFFSQRGVIDLPGGFFILSGPTIIGLAWDLPNADVVKKARRNGVIKRILPITLPVCVGGC